MLSSELARFPSVGIVSEDGTGLDGWIMTRADGCLGTLHVMDSCRRMGYGQALVQQLLRYHEEAPLSLLCDGAGPRTPIAYTAWWNSVSIQLFSKLGFVQSGSVSWIYFVSTAPCLQ